MSEVKHTPGPWKVGPSINVQAGRKNICSRINSASKDQLNIREDIEVAKANARLIAASPELLEALEQFVAWVDAPCESAFSDSQLASARAAIAKATGEPQ